MALKTTRRTINNPVTFRNDLNAIAELGWHEYKTTRYIRSHIPVRPVRVGYGAGKTGLLYRIGKGNKSLLLRADIDALKTDTGVRHICGHSTHTAALMSALIKTQENEMLRLHPDKSVFFLFQPAEETYPSGAAAFIAENPEVLKSIRYAFALHVRPLMNKGVIGLRAGPVMARGDYFEIKVSGKMSHIKNPFAGIDAIDAASLIIREFKTIQERHANELRLNVGVIEGGRQSNTIADRCILKGDIRLKNESAGKRVKSKMESVLRKVERKTKATSELAYFPGYPVLSNSPLLVTQLREPLEKQFAVRTESLFSYGCEDFSFISSHVPSLYAFVGTGDRTDIHEAGCTISDAGTRSASLYFQTVLDWWFASDYSCK